MPLFVDHSYISGEWGVPPGQSSLEAACYSGRVLASTSQGNRVVFQQGIAAPDLAWIQDHYRRVGLQIASDIWFETDGVPEGFDLSVFMMSERLNRIYRRPELLHAVRTLNHKNVFLSTAMMIAPESVPETVFFGEPAHFVGTDWDEAFLKPAVSASGDGIVECTTRGAIIDAVNALEPKTAFQLQRPVNAKAWLNVMYFAKGGQWKREALTVQLVENNCYKGSRQLKEHDYNPWPLTDQFAQYAVSQGIEGYFAFDVAVLEDGTYLIIECNGRWNGATYSHLPAKKLGIESWMSCKVEADRRSLEGLDLGDLEYDHASGRGVILINWGTIQDRYVSALFAGTPADQGSLYSELQSALG